MKIATHGFSTERQRRTYVVTGTIFWATIILISTFLHLFLAQPFLANWYSLQMSRGVTTFLTSTCHRNYKKCVQVASMDYCGHLMKQCHETEKFILPEPVSTIENVEVEPLIFSNEENEVNLRRCQKKQFYDQAVCRHLCSKTLVLESTRTNPISPCESICFELTKSSDSAGEVCPTQKYCQNGCPCPFYECEKLEFEQRLVPVFDLAEAKDSTVENIHLISGRWSDRGTTQEVKNQKFPIILSDFNGRSGLVTINASDSLVSYERVC